MVLTKYVACICEGAAEKAIMEILLDADKLTFKRDDLLEGELIRCRSGKNFEEQHLRKGFTERITVLRILDSRREQFRPVKPMSTKLKSSTSSPLQKSKCSLFLMRANTRIIKGPVKSPVISAERI